MNVRLTIETDELSRFCRRHGIRRLCLFGSVLREDFRPDSDIDVLVEFSPDSTIGLLGLQAIEEELGRMFGRRVDVNTPGFLNARFRDKALAEAKELYVAA